MDCGDGEKDMEGPIVWPDVDGIDGIAVAGINGIAFNLQIQISILRMEARLK
jgi:hypothetical protein